MEAAGVVALERVGCAVVEARQRWVSVSILHVVADHRVSYLLAVLVHDFKL